MALAEVYLDSDHKFRYKVQRDNNDTGAVEAAAAVSGVTAHFSVEDGGAAIPGTSTALTEYSGKPGTYHGILDAASVRAALAAHEDAIIYEVFLVDGDDETSEPILVKAIRRPS